MSTPSGLSRAPPSLPTTSSRVVLAQVRAPRPPPTDETTVVEAQAMAAPAVQVAAQVAVRVVPPTETEPNEEVRAVAYPAAFTRRQRRNGGGYLRIFANQIFVNGSIHVNGGDGDAGSAPSSGTGHGGSGAGGGSGGAVFIQANSVLVGNGGQIKADGGDGGDGANGVQQGAGIMMYDGGDGGGGGAGGRIVINTQTGGYSNSGTVQAAAGSGDQDPSTVQGDGVDGVRFPDGHRTWKLCLDRNRRTTPSPLIPSTPKPANFPPYLPQHFGPMMLPTAISLC